MAPLAALRAARIAGAAGRLRPAARALGAPPRRMHAHAHEQQLQRRRHLFGGGGAAAAPRGAAAPPPPRARGRALQELLRGEDGEAADDDAAAPAVDALPAWAPPLAVLRYPDPRLRAPNAPLGPAAFGPPLRALAAAMFDAMYDDDGCGLSAPQVGLNLRLMVWNAAGRRGEGEEIVLVNPRLLSTGGAPTLFEEGCLSFPGIYADVRRPSKVRVKAQDLAGKAFTLSLSGFAARVFQHEYDHLSGTLYHDRMEPGVRAGIAAELAALEAAWAAAHPGEPLPERVAR